MYFISRMTIIHTTVSSHTPFYREAEPLQRPARITQLTKRAKESLDEIRGHVTSYRPNPAADNQNTHDFKDLKNHADPRVAFSLTDNQLRLVFANYLEQQGKLTTWLTRKIAADTAGDKSLSQRILHIMKDHARVLEGAYLTPGQESRIRLQLEML